MSGVQVVFGVRGGVGATDVAARLCRASRGFVAIDLDTARGDLAARLGVTMPSGTVATLASVGADTVTASDLRSVASSAAGGVVLASPAQPELVDYVGVALVTDILRSAVELGPVVIDAGGQLDVAAFAALRCATRIVLVARADAACAVQTGRVSSLIQRSGLNVPTEVALPMAPRMQAAAFARSVRLPLATVPASRPGAIGALRSWLGGGHARGARSGFGVRESVYGGR